MDLHTNQKGCRSPAMPGMPMGAFPAPLCHQRGNCERPDRLPQGRVFRKEIPVSNGSVPVWQSITNAATGQASIIGKRQSQFLRWVTPNWLSGGTRKRRLRTNACARGARPKPTAAPPKCAEAATLLKPLNWSITVTDCNSIHSMSANQAGI